MLEPKFKAMKIIKSLFGLLVFFLLSQNTKAQGAYFGANFGLIELEQFKSRPIVGIGFQYEFKNGFGIEYNIHAGSNYFQIPSSPSLGFSTYKSFSSAKASDESSIPGGAFLLGILIGVLPEGIFYSIRVNETFDISPHINPLQQNFIKNDYQDRTENLYGGSAGVRLYIYSSNNKSRFAPFVDYKFLYQGNTGNGLVFGFSWFSTIRK
jgi:hypothetical protein